MMFDGAVGRDTDTSGMFATAVLPRDRDEWREIHRQLRRLAARRGALDTEEARSLLAARRAEVHRHLGLGSFVEYVERVLGYAPRTTFERLRVAEALEKLPATRDALASGQAAYSAVREITRIATPDTEREWLAAVQAKTVRDVEALVAGHAVGDRPEDPVDPNLRPRHVRFELPPDVYALLVSARRHLELQTGARLSDADFVASLCNAVLAHGGDGSSARAPRHQIALTICERCKRGWQDAAGQVIEVPPAAVERAQCDAQHIGRVDGDRPAPVTQDIPAAVRRQVERRDHGCCRVPGCRLSSNLVIHHVIPRAAGGDHEPDRLLLVCTPHHRAIHDDRLAITGAAPDFRFTGADGRPYGAVALDPDPDPAPNIMADARSALRNLGYSAAEATAAVDQARARVGRPVPLETLIRLALRCCLPPTEGGSEEQGAGTSSSGAA